MSSWVAISSASWSAVEIFVCFWSIIKARTAAILQLRWSTVHGSLTWSSHAWCSLIELFIFDSKWISTRRSCAIGTTWDYRLPPILCLILFIKRQIICPQFIRRRRLYRKTMSSPLHRSNIWYEQIFYVNQTSAFCILIWLIVTELLLFTI